MDRTITISSQFARFADRDEVWSEAMIETVGHTYRLIVKIDGLADLRLPGIQTHGKDADHDREKARQWMALCELAHRSTSDFQKHSGVSPDVDVSIPDPPGGGPNWTMEEAWQYVSQRLAGYHIKEWKPGLWQAKARD